MTAFIQLGINTYTALKADYEQDLLRITNQISLLSCKSAALAEDLMTEIRSVYDYDAILTSENSEEIAQRIEAFNSSEFYASYETQLALINSKEKLLEAEKQQVETKLKATEQLLESMEKRQESNIKKEIYSF